MALYLGWGDERLPARFWDKVLPEPTSGCLLWTRSVDTESGYAQFHHEGKTKKVHRLAYVTLIGHPPVGLELDHSCRVRSCVNPHHLEPVTKRINILRGESLSAKRARQTKCLYGHPFDDENTKVYRGMRYCRKCRLRRQQEQRARRRLAGV